MPKKKQVDETTRKEARYHHFMVDTETLGVLPNCNPVLQIALVEFDPVSFQPTGKELTVFLPLVEQLQKGAVADKGTVEWWNKPERIKALTEVMQGVNKAGTVEEELMKIYRWIETVCKPEGTEMGKTMFWAKPTLFDYPMVEG